MTHKIHSRQSKDAWDSPALGPLAQTRLWTISGLLLAILTSTNPHVINAGREIGEAGS